MADNARAAALVALVAVAPLAIVLVIALLRGYNISIHFRRNGKKDEE